MNKSATNEPGNFLFLFSDEHNRKITGCYGHPFIKTPNIDALAARGTVFDTAYCNSPICVPSRASMATGRHVHEIGCWDNAHPWKGQPRGWHHGLRDAGVDVISIGKLHFRGGDDYGYTDERLPVHVVDGKGDLKALFRDRLGPKARGVDMAGEAGRGESSYSLFDQSVAADAVSWLADRAASGNEKPFALVVNFVMPHFPLVAQAPFYDLYEKYDLEMLQQGLTTLPSEHPSVRAMRTYMNYDGHFDEETKAIALRAYFGMVSHVDALVGEVLAALEEHGFTDATRVVYSSDHGDNLGNRGMWGKSCMYDDAAAIPLVAAGPGIPRGARVATPVSLLDIAPTAHEVTGAPLQDDLPGDSLLGIANGALPDRAIMSQYHAAGSETGTFMVRKGRWKYVYYCGRRPQLFDLEADPEEVDDRWDDPGCQEILADLEAELRAICDPDEVNRRAFADQKRTIEANGGYEAIQGTTDIPFTPVPA